MENIQSFKNKDLISRSQDDFEKSITNDFINDDFISQLEWGMMITQGKMKQMSFSEDFPTVKMSHFDKSFLMSGKDSLIDEKRMIFLNNFSEYQVTPEIFPLLNVKTFNISDTISFTKIKELDVKAKRNIISKPFKNIFEYSMAFYKKDTESFYGNVHGYGINPDFFKLNLNDTKSLIKILDLEKNIENRVNVPQSSDDIRVLKSSAFKNMLRFFYPICLAPGCMYNDSIIQNEHNKSDYGRWSWEWNDAMIKIAFAYQIAMTMYYEWTIYIREYENIGFIIPIEPSILSEIYKTSMVKFDSKRRMLHFVKDHYRRRRAEVNEDYSVYVHRYLRGENKFDYRSFYAEIIPPRYDLNRVKTRKKFIDTMQD